MKATPKSISVSASVGGKIQIVQYQYTSNYYYSMSQEYSVEDMTEEEAKKFREDKLIGLREELEPIVQGEVDELIRMRDELKGE